VPTTDCNTFQFDVPIIVCHDVPFQYAVTIISSLAVPDDAPLIDVQNHFQNLLISTWVALFAFPIFFTFVPAVHEIPQGVDDRY